MISKAKNYFKRNRNIVVQFVKRETASRYKGSYLGFLWSVLTPLLMLIVYTFVFGEIFQAKWHAESTNKLEYAVIIFAGLTTYNLFSEVVGRSPFLILSNTNYVKKVVFPLEVFPVIAVGSALVNAAINFVLIAIFTVIVNHTLHWTVILLPIVILPLLFFTLGVSWLLSALGVFLRDIGQVIAIVIQALMLLSPILYSVDTIPLKFRWFYYLNPITYFVGDIRNVMIWGKVPILSIFVLELLVSIIICVVGLFFFRKTKHGFADVM
ncbi:sugar ABC transporter permease [Paenibacillus sp. CFBP13512]|uniref:ABC transporter permease n=1 Tax=Paenibacillus sp. CFBP13512 TaxID=2184007 RepID=UPI0010C08F1F|nr:ABC transporter permease [Paenibacillus sp. CFBP13512]TKJ86649.1 sugar ABC transporter permease [Paenibacillus sp. CFBP13512]